MGNRFLNPDMQVGQKAERPAGRGTRLRVPGPESGLSPSTALAGHVPPTLQAWFLTVKQEDCVVFWSCLFMIGKRKAWQDSGWLLGIWESPTCTTEMPTPPWWLSCFSASVFTECSLQKECSQSSPILLEHSVYWLSLKAQCTLDTTHLSSFISYHLSHHLTWWSRPWPTSCWLLLIPGSPSYISPSNHFIWGSLLPSWSLPLHFCLCMHHCLKSSDLFVHLSA